MWSTIAYINMDWCRSEYWILIKKKSTSDARAADFTLQSQCVHDPSGNSSSVSCSHCSTKPGPLWSSSLLACLKCLCDDSPVNRPTGPRTAAVTGASKDSKQVQLFQQQLAESPERCLKGKCAAPLPDSLTEVSQFASVLKHPGTRPLRLGRATFVGRQTFY